MHINQHHCLAPLLSTSFTTIRPSSSSCAPLPKQCMNLSKGKMLYHLANEYFIVCKTMYSRPFDWPPFLAPLPPLPLPSTPLPLLRLLKAPEDALILDWLSYRVKDQPQVFRHITSGASSSSVPIGPFDKAECFGTLNVVISFPRNRIKPLQLLVRLHTVQWSPNGGQDCKESNKS